MACVGRRVFRDVWVVMGWRIEVVIVVVVVVVGGLRVFAVVGVGVVVVGVAGHGI
jgi:hypothetical protein